MRWLVKRVGTLVKFFSLSYTRVILLELLLVLILITLITLLRLLKVLTI